MDPYWIGFLETLQTVATSIGVLGVATLVQTTLKVSARSNGSGATPVDMVTWEDAVFWMDWTTNILVAFIVLSLKANGSGQFAFGQFGTFLICLFLGGMIVPQFVRWYCTDPTSGNITKNGMKLSNAASATIILMALFAGVNLFA